MSEARRAYNLLRGFVNREWERLQGVEVSEAERELDTQPVQKSQSPAEVSKAERIEAIERQVQACNILGVVATASFEEIRHAFDKLNRRSDPSNFPVGSTEAQHASDIQKRVHWAYQVLTDEMDVSEKRFRSLEIE
jgi:preprotein translocase subunit Sec63